MLSVHSSPLARLGGKEAGGMNVYVRELARELGRQGVLVDIFTRSQHSAEPFIAPLDHGARVVNLHTGPSAPYDKNWVLAYLPEFVSRVRCFADGEDLSYDVIHSHYWLSGEAALALRRSWRVPVVHMFHTLGALKNSVARSAAETETGQRIAIERRLMESADRIVAATPLDRAQMVWHYGARADHINVVPGGVDLAQFSPRPQAEARARLGLPPRPARLLVCVGRMEPLKGMDALIRALALLRASDAPWAKETEVLLVGGEGEDRPEAWNEEQRRLHGLRVELGVAGAVRFCGAQPQGLLVDYYAAADAVAVPSHYESFGLAALEALASGAPVVASNVGGLSTIVEDGTSGFLVPHDNPEALAQRLAALLSDGALRAQMAAGARPRAERYGWPTVAREIRRVYAEAQRGRGQRAALGARTSHRLHINS
jgi:D-inositol-3-phosphate glycosyltransferase